MKVACTLLYSIFKLGKILGVDTHCEWVLTLGEKFCIFAVEIRNLKLIKKSRRLEILGDIDY